MYPILLKLWNFPIYTYGFFVFLGVIAGYYLSLRQARIERIDKEKFSNIFFWIIIASFLGAKLLYIAIEWKFFIENPLLSVRSGFVFYGGMISGFLALFYFTKKYNINTYSFADCLAPGVALGHALGRVGCFFYGCCYGKACESQICLLFPADSPAGFAGTRVLPIQLISAFFLIIIALILVFLSKNRKYKGQIFISYFVIYGLFRFIIEFFRGDVRGSILFFSTSQFIALILVIIGIFMHFRLKKYSS